MLGKKIDIAKLHQKLVCMKYLGILNSHYQDILKYHLTLKIVSIMRYHGIDTDEVNTSANFVKYDVKEASIV